MLSLFPAASQPGRLVTPYLSFLGFLTIPMMMISLLFFNNRFWLMHFVVKMKRNFHSLPPIPIPIPITIPMMMMIYAAHACVMCGLP